MDGKDTKKNKATPNEEADGPESRGGTMGEPRRRRVSHLTEIMIHTLMNGRPIWIVSTSIFSLMFSVGTSIQLTCGMLRRSPA